MKNINDLIEENQDLIAKYPPPFVNYEKKELNKARKTITLNKMCISALEMGATKDQMEKDLERLKAKIQYNKDNYKKWLKHTPKAEYGKDPVAYYARLCETKKMKEQIKFLEYILE